MGEWQPIETVPYDSREVLFYRKDYGMAVWPARSAWPNATHWMPLPEPPEER